MAPHKQNTLRFSVVKPSSSRLNTEHIFSQLDQGDNPQGESNIRICRAGVQISCYFKFIFETKPL